MSENQLTITAYGAAKVVNAALKEAGFDKVIPPQMMYNYTTARVRKGKKPYIAMDEQGRILVDDLKRWLTKYLEDTKNRAAL
jgi:hypothetical protein